MYADKNRQQGVALLIIAIILMLASASYIVSDISLDEIRADRQTETSIALKKAKSALIAHAITNTYRGVANLGEIGNLPCPDLNNNSSEGDQESICGASDVNAVGYYPWKRMGGDVLKDASGNCLLYAVSPSYKLNPPRMLNQDTTGLFQIVDADDNVIVGNFAADRPVAIIFAPNEVVGAQARNFDATTICGKDFGNLSAYLDNNGVRDNSALVLADNTIDRFTHATSTPAIGADPLNDTFTTISSAEIWDNIFARTDLNTKLTEVTEALAVCLADYANNALNPQRQLPWPAQIDLSGLPDSYVVDANYADVNDAAFGYAGRFPYVVNSSNAETGMVGVDLVATASCTSINLPSTALVDETIDLSASGEHGIIWRNWKDHFFYALSRKYEPDNTAVADSICDGVSGCVSVGGAVNEYAAVIFFGNVSTNGRARTDGEVVDVADIDEKASVMNYLENGNDVIFPDLLGQGDFNTNVLPANDIMFCITDELNGVNINVSAC